MPMSKCDGALQPFAYFWKTHGALIDVFVRQSPSYRSALAAGAAPETALAELKSNQEFMVKLRADKTRLQAGFVAMIQSPVMSKPGSAVATSRATSLITSHKPGVSQARRLKRLFTALRLSRGCRLINALPTEQSKSASPTVRFGALPTDRSRRAGV